MERRHSRGRLSVETGMKKFGRKNLIRREIRRHLSRNFNLEVADDGKNKKIEYKTYSNENLSSILETIYDIYLIIALLKRRNILLERGKIRVVGVYFRFEKNRHGLIYYK